MFKLSFSFTTLAKALFMAALIAVAPLVVNAEGTDLQEGSQGNIDRSSGKSDPVIQGGGELNPAGLDSSPWEGTDLERTATGAINPPAGKEPVIETGGELRPAGLDSGPMEGTDLEKTASGAINPPTGEDPVVQIDGK